MTLKLVMGLGPGATSRLAQVVLVPVEQAQPVPVGQAYWNRLCLSHWHKQAGCTKLVPLGLGEVKGDLSLCHGTSHIPTMEGIPCAMAQALYHDGACTCSTCANLCQKVGLQGRGKVYHNNILFERLGPTYDFGPLKLRLKLILFGQGRTWQISKNKNEHFWKSRLGFFLFINISEQYLLQFTLEFFELCLRIN